MDRKNCVENIAKLFFHSSLLAGVALLICANHLYYVRQFCTLHYEHMDEYALHLLDFNTVRMHKKHQ